MATSSKGARRRTRSKLKKGLRDKFKPESIIQGFKAGDKVIISIDPSSMKGMPHTRFKGNMGTVAGMRGSALIVNTYIGKKKKEIYVSPEHLKRV